MARNQTSAPKGAAKTQTQAKKDRKSAKANGAAPAKNARIVKAIVKANKTDDAALLHDGSTHLVTDYFRHGVTVKAGDNFDTVKAAYLAKVRAAAEKPKGAGHLAKGLDSRNAPHSAKAVADNAAAARKGAAPAKADKTAKRAERKAARTAKAAPKSDDTRKIVIVDKKFTFGRDGTARHASWVACKGAKTVADYAKAGGALKYLPRWVSAGAIRLG